MKIKYSISFLLLIITINGFCQSQKTSIDSLKQILPFVKNDTTRVNLFNTIADKFKELNPDSTAYFALRATRLSQKINYNFGLANAYLNTGNSHIILGNYRKANHYFDKAQLGFENELKANSGIEVKRIKNGLARVFASQGVVF